MTASPKTRLNHDHRRLMKQLETVDDVTVIKPENTLSSL
jgi:hypothetical protein